MQHSRIENTSVAEATPPARVRLEYLDGLRGLAALYVVLHHAYEQIAGQANHGGLSDNVLLATGWLRFGNLAVDVFIVLSGYCLMLPVVRSTNNRFAVVDFVKRRARRIMPPYYAALASSFLLIQLVPFLGTRSGAYWDVSLPANTWGVVVSHILLIHNLSPKWIHKVDYPLWSVATEWQIYFLFSFLLLPIWRRLGLVAAVVAGFLFWVLVHFFSHAYFDGAYLHLTSLFTFGMAAADIGFSTDKSRKLWRDIFPWGIFASVTTLSISALLAYRPQWQAEHTSHLDVLTGIATAALLVYCTSCLSQPGTLRPWIVNCFESKAALKIGYFSYSLYLVHAPILAVCWGLIRPDQFPPTLNLALMLIVGPAVSILLSYFFFLVFEQRFLKTSQSRTPIMIK